MASSAARPSTSDGKGGVAAASLYGNGDRRGIAATKPKRNMANKALIVCKRWRPSICGGLPDALHQAIRLLQDMDISVHCTALQATIEEVEDAEKHRVTLVLPEPSGTLKFRKQHRDWLLHHYEYYPNLEELANVKFVFGFTGFTSEAAFKITSKVFPRRSCYLINLYDEDDLTPLIVGCSKEELEFRKRIMSTEFAKARCAFSLGESVFLRYQKLYQETQQYRLSPTVNEKYVTSLTSGELREHEKFQIITLLQEYELQNCDKIEVVIEALKTAAGHIHQKGENRIAWKIVGVPPHKVDAVLHHLRRTSSMDITPKLVTNTEGLDKELLSSHLVLIPPSSTNYSNLTLAAMSAGIPVVYPKMSHCHATVNKYIDKLEAKECAIDMDGGPEDLKKKILSVICNYRRAWENAKSVKKYIKEKVIGNQQGLNKEFLAALSDDFPISPTKDQADLSAEQKASTSQENTVESGDMQTLSQETESIPKTKRARAAENEQAPDEMVTDQTESNPTSTDVRGVLEDGKSSRRKRRQSNEAHTSDDVQRASTGEKEVESVSKSKQARTVEHIPAPEGVLREPIQVNPVPLGISKEPSEKKSTKRGKKTSKRDNISADSTQDTTRPQRTAKKVAVDRMRAEKGKRKRHSNEIELKVKPDGIIPGEGNTVRDVDRAFYSNRRTKENADKFGKHLDHCNEDMELTEIGDSSISYIMTCRSLEALESLMDSYRNESLQWTVTSTFVSDQLLRDIGAIYLSLGVTIDYEEYYLCREELEDADADTVGVDFKEQRTSADNSSTDVTALQQKKKLEEIESMNDKMDREIKAKQISNSVEQRRKREKVKNRDILRAMENEEKRDCDAKIDELMSEWIDIKKDLKDVSETQSGLVFTRRQLIQKAGAIIHEVDIPLEIKQELLLVFQKFLPAGPEKTTEPDPKLVIEGSVLMDYVENTVHDTDIPTERKQEIIQRFSDLIKDESKKMTVKDRLTAQQVKLQERANAVVHDANIPDQLKETYVNWRRVERGTPLSNTVRVLLSRDGKKSSGEVINPYGLTINQNGHVLVCDIGHGSVKTVTADTAQILTSVTVHGLPHIFQPTDTKMADNGDYYTADIGNKCIVVSDAKSEVKQIIAMGKLKCPTGVFVDKDRNVFIADYSADCVIKCNGDGDIISSQQLSKPWSLTMNSKYQLIVSCQGDVKCIYVLDSNLEILNQFGSDHLVNPWGVTVDNADNIYVADNRKIVKFDRQGEYQETVTVDVDPWYIAVFTDGRIVYSDYSDSTVKVIYK
ncbi:uncharacterized protein [Ptychodera flava]|uniref:uncharacterized protein n=1 Tax=Ptychodera flava TaxID=63121 RepID=UPI003969EC36